MSKIGFSITWIKVQFSCSRVLEPILTFRINEVNRILVTIHKRTHPIIVLHQRIRAKPSGGPGTVKPRAEVQVRGSGGGADAGEVRQRRACNFLAAKAVALLGTVRRAAGCPHPRDRSVRIVIKSLAYVACSVLDYSDAAEVVLDHVEDLVAARAGQQAAALPVGALEGDRAVRGLVEYYISEVEIMPPRVCPKR